MNEYDDIIGLPHWEPRHHKRMPAESRAAQFAPFAALVGHDEAIRETARTTDDKIELEDDARDMLSTRLRHLVDRLDARPLISVVYFQKDELKKGGKYVSYQGVPKKYDECDAAFVFEDGERILIETILNVDGEIFNYMDQM